MGCLKSIVSKIIALALVVAFFYFGGATHCGTWDLSSPTGIEPMPAEVDVQSLSHWNASITF